MINGGLGVVLVLIRKPWSRLVRRVSSVADSEEGMLDALA